MLNIFKKKQSKGETVAFKIKGMHCTSCSMAINGELEDTQGVVEAKTNYAKSLTRIVFDSKQVSVKKLQEIIEKLGYSII